MVDTRKQVLTLPLGGGIDDSLDPRLLDGPLVATASDVILTKQGAYRKRRGMASISTNDLPVSDSGLNSIFDVAGRPTLYGRDGVWQYSETGDEWMQLQGGPPPVEVSSMGGVYGSYSVESYDTASNGTELLEVWTVYDAQTAAALLFYRVRDLATDAVLVQTTYLDQATTVQVVRTGNFAHVVYLDVTTNIPQRLRYKFDDRTWSGPTAIGVAAIGAYDIAAGVIDNTNYWVLAASEDVGGDSGIVVFDETGGIDDTDSIALAEFSYYAGEHRNAIRVYCTDERIHVAGTRYDGITTVELNLASFPVDLVLGTFTITGAGLERGAALEIEGVQTWTTCAIGETLGGSIFAAISVQDQTDEGVPSNGFGTTKWNLFDYDDLTDVGDEFVTVRTRLAQRCFVPDDRNLMWGVESGQTEWAPARDESDPGQDLVGAPVPLFPTTILLEIDESTVSVDSQDYTPTATVQGYPIPVARCNYDISNHQREAGYLSHPIEYGTSWLFPSGVETSGRVDRTVLRIFSTGGRFYTAGSTARAGALAAVNFVPQPARAIPLGKFSLLNQGGFLLHVANTAFESGFIAGAAHNRSNDFDWMTAGDVINYIARHLAIVVVKDSSGVVFREVPSSEFIIRNVAPPTPDDDDPGLFVIELPDITLRRPNFADRPFLQIYACPYLEQDPADGNSPAWNPPNAPFQLLGEAPLVKQADGTFIAAIDANFINAGSTAFPSGGEAHPPYTTGDASDILAAEPVPPFVDIALAGGRVWGIHAERRNTAWFSKLMEPGIAVEWNTGLTVSAPPGEAFVGLAPLDEKIILFTKERIYFVPPPAVDNRGEGSPAEPEMILSDTGCIEARSLATTPDGVLFRGKRGIYLLDRSLQVRYVGGPIEERLSGRAQDIPALTIVATVLVAEDHEVRFCTEEGYIFVYHYLRGTWSTREGVYVHACTVDGTFHAAQQTDAGWAATKDLGHHSAIWTDDGVGVSAAAIHNLMIVETGWLKISALDGFHRIKRIMILGETLADDSGRIKVSLSYDYDDTVVNEYYWPTASSVDTIDEGLLSIRVVPGQQKSRAIKIRVEELQVQVPFGEELADGENGPGHILSGITLELDVLAGRSRQHDVSNQR